GSGNSFRFQSSLLSNVPLTPWSMTMNPPNALCFGSEFPAAGMPCHAELSETGLTLHFTAACPADNGSTVPYTRLTVSGGGLDHNQLVGKWETETSPRTLYLRDPVVIKRFRHMAPPDLTRHVEAAAAQVRHVRTQSRRLWYLAMGSVGALVLLLWLGSDWLVELAVDRIPVEWEQKLGESAYHDFLAHQDILKEGLAVTAMNEITQRLTGQILDNRYKFEVTVVKSDVVNAFALPG